MALQHCFGGCGCKLIFVLKEHNPPSEHNEPSTRRRHGLVPVGGFSLAARSEPHTSAAINGH